MKKLDAQESAKTPEEMEPTMTNLTAESLALFLAYADDAGNWSGNPWVDGNVTLGASGRGNLTDLKRKGYLTTQDDDGDAFIIFTPAGVALAAEHGIDLSWVL